MQLLSKFKIIQFQFCGISKCRCVEMYERVGQGALEVYKAELEDPLVEDTREYYARASQEWINSMTTPEYLERVRHLFQFIYTFS